MMYHLKDYLFTKEVEGYISQKAHLFQAQPNVTCKIREYASLGGRNTGSWYCIIDLEIVVYSYSFGAKK